MRENLWSEKNLPHRNIMDATTVMQSRRGKSSDLSSELQALACSTERGRSGSAGGSSLYLSSPLLTHRLTFATVYSTQHRLPVGGVHPLTVSRRAHLTSSQTRGRQPRYRLPIHDAHYRQRRRESRSPIHPT